MELTRALLKESFLRLNQRFKLFFSITRMQLSTLDLAMTVLAPVSPAAHGAVQDLCLSKVFSVNRSTLLTAWTFDVDRQASGLHPVPLIEDGVVGADYFSDPPRDDCRNTMSECTSSNNSLTSSLLHRVRTHGTKDRPQSLGYLRLHVCEHAATT